MNIVFIVKGTSRSKRKTIKAIASIKSSGLFKEVQIWHTEYAGQAISLASKACGQFDYLIAVGGDGTLNEVVNGCLQVKVHNEEGKPQKLIPIIGVLPQGTANDFIKTISITGKADELLELIKSESHSKVDIGQISYCNENGSMEKRYFLNIASVGIGANVVQCVNKSKKYLGANLTFLLAIVRTFLSYQPRALSVESNDFCWQGEALTLAIANGRYFGSGLCIAPHAKVNDGLFGITLLGQVSVKDFVMKFGQLKKGVMIKHPEVIYQQASFIEVTSSSPDCAVEADGEFLGFSPIRIEILPGELSFLMPSKAG